MKPDEATAAERQRDKLLMPPRALRSSTGSRLNSKAAKASQQPQQQHSKAKVPLAGTPERGTDSQPASVPRADLSALTPRHRDVVRLLYRKFTQHVRFASSVQMNHRKCESFLAQYGLTPHPKHLEEAVRLLLEDIHNVGSYYNAHPSPANGRVGSKMGRGESPARGGRATNTIFSTCAPRALPGFVDALQWIAVANSSLARPSRKSEQQADAAPGADGGTALLAQILEEQARRDSRQVRRLARHGAGRRKRSVGPLGR